MAAPFFRVLLMFLWTSVFEVVLGELRRVIEMLQAGRFRDTGCSLR